MSKQNPGNFFERKAAAKAWLESFDPAELASLRAEVQSLKSLNEKLCTIIQSHQIGENH